MGKVKGWEAQSVTLGLEGARGRGAAGRPHYTRLTDDSSALQTPLTVLRFALRLMDDFWSTFFTLQTSWDNACAPFLRGSRACTCTSLIGKLAFGGKLIQARIAARHIVDQTWKVCSCHSLGHTLCLSCAPVMKNRSKMHVRQIRLADTHKGSNSMLQCENAPHNQVENDLHSLAFVATSLFIFAVFSVSYWMVNVPWRSQMIYSEKIWCRQKRHVLKWQKVLQTRRTFNQPIPSERTDQCEWRQHILQCNILRCKCNSENASVCISENFPTFI